MGIMVDSLLWVMQALYHQQYDPRLPPTCQYSPNPALRPARYVSKTAGAECSHSNSVLVMAAILAYILV